MLLPHPPYVLDEQGNAVPDDVAAKRSTAERYEAQMRYLDTRIEAVVDRLLDVPEEERPIIILMADEGPYPKRYEGNPLIQGRTPTSTGRRSPTKSCGSSTGSCTRWCLPGVDEGDIPRR